MGDQGAREVGNDFVSDRSRRMSDNEGSTIEAPEVRNPPAQPDDPSGIPRQPARLGAPSVSRQASRRSSRSISKPEPPVTKATLSELDVTKIIHNPKLRHDINFDPELHFRPNMDGEKGRRKQEKASEFWTTLSEQLSQFALSPTTFSQIYPRDEEWCLPALLRAVKEIIQTLVPTKDRDVLDEGLNVELLMQQFNRGTVDLEKLAFWLARVLKQHCAPMRDEWVDDMYNDLSNGNRLNDINRLVNGMRSLLLVLEAMKLDVANHQIRCLRPVLIEDTVHFEQRFFQKKILSGKLEVHPAKKWFDATREQVSQNPNPRERQTAMSEMDIFFMGLARLVHPSNEVSFASGEGSTRPSEAASKVPSTFVFDEERLLKLRSDMLDAINLEICMRVYEQADCPMSHAASLHIALSVPTYVADMDSSSTSDASFDFNTPPSSRPSSFVGSSHSSPRNSAQFSSQPFDFVEAKTRSSNLYSSLLDLLHTAPHAARATQRWRDLTPALAVQIFRYLNAPPSALSEIEKNLREAFKFNSPLYMAVEEKFSRRLYQELMRRVKEFKILSGIGLFTLATGGRTTQGPSREWAGGRENPTPSQEGSVRDAQEEGGVEDMAIRLAHLGILHWRVWAQLAYADDNVAPSLDETRSANAPGLSPRQGDTTQTTREDVLMTSSC